MTELRRMRNNDGDGEAAVLPHTTNAATRRGGGGGAAAALFVHLTGGETQPLPSGDYVRIVALHAHGTDAARTTRRSDFALHYRGARFCRLLDSLLDADVMDVAAATTTTATTTMPPSRGNVDAAPSSSNNDGSRSGSSSSKSSLPPVVIPQATQAGCECLFRYLDLLLTRVPTLISKPLKAPLEELTQPWEMQYVLDCCDLGLDNNNNNNNKSTGSDGNNSNNKDVRCVATSVVLRAVSRHGTRVLDRLLEVAMLSEFLLVESLRDLIAAFLASLALSTTTPDELLQLCGRDRPLSEQELAPLYAQFPFLRVSNDA